MRRHEHSWSFSLVELLVTLAVIAILAALLLPTLQSARAKGEEIVCISNLKQCGSAMVLYWNDFENHYPPYTDWKTSWWRMFTALKYISGTGLNSSPLTSSSGEDLSKAFGILRCPSAKPLAIASKNKGYTGTHYSMNYFHFPQFTNNEWVGGGGRWKKAPLTASCLSKIAHFADNIRECGDTTKDADPSPIYFDRMTFSSQNWPRYKPFRHAKGKGVNFLYLDCHAGLRIPFHEPLEFNGYADRVFLFSKSYYNADGSKK